jgi:excisionase family DNA binding protein
MSKHKSQQPSSGSLSVERHVEDDATGMERLQKRTALRGTQSPSDDMNRDAEVTSYIGDVVGTGVTACDVNSMPPPLTVREAASFLGLSDDVTRDLLRTKRLVGFKASGQWRVLTSSLSEYIVAQLSKR